MLPEQPGSPLRPRTRLPPDPTCQAQRHDTRNAYVAYRCRCPAAREADRLYRKRLRHGLQPSHLVDATGSRRRLQALAVMGWPADDLAPRLGLWSTTVRDIRLGARRVQRATADRIKRVYRDLVDVKGPSTSAAARARARGWVSPLAWDDIDDPQARPVFGRAPDAEHARSVEDIRERRELIHRLWREGRNDAEIAEVIGGQPNAIKKVRYRNRWTTPQGRQVAA